MCYFPTLVLSAAILAQSPQTPEKDDSQAKDANKAAVSVSKDESADPKQNTADAKDVEKPQGPPEPVDSELDKYLRTVADKIDKIPYVSATIHQTIRVQDQYLRASGTYRIGPDYRLWFELNVRSGDAHVRRVQACDGKIGYRYSNEMNAHRLTKFDMSTLMPLIDSKEISDQGRQQIYSFLPLVRPGDMIRGYLQTLTFTEKEQGTLGEDKKMKVVVLNGQWRPAALVQLTGNPNVKSVEDLGGAVIQYARLYLEKKTEWPVRIELYRIDDQAEYKPQFVLEFGPIEFLESIPDSKFTFEPPEEAVAQDQTLQFVQILRAQPDKKGAGSTQVSAPIVSEKDSEKKSEENTKKPNE